MSNEFASYQLSQSFSTHHSSLRYGPNKFRSNHRSYKSSRIHLRRLPTRGERIVVPPGENAGVVDVGDDWCVAFKIESHNHPSFIEPFQGAATGVGGILRDVFTMGARP